MKKIYLLLLLPLIVALLLVEERWGVLKEGSIAPPFAAKLSSGTTISLQDLRGKNNVVLFFYPKDFTPGCTEQVCSLRDNHKNLEGLDAVILGVSRDDKISHAKFIETHRLPFPLISDEGTSLIKAYGVERLGGLIGPPKRVTYVIDKQGTIRLAAHHEFFIGRHLEDVMRTLKQIEGDESSD